MISEERRRYVSWPTMNVINLMLTVIKYSKYRATVLLIFIAEG